ncbi:MAG: NfeD family protein [bacterium]|nr:NfeD family protein [bacterium]
MPLWIIWGIVGILFLVAEALTVGFFLGWFGIAAIIAAVLAAINLPFGYQVGAFVVCAIVGILISRKFSDKVTIEPPRKSNVDRLLDQKGIVLETIDNSKGTGRVKVDRDVWLADSVDDSVIEKDSTIKVLEIQGTHLIVEKIQ